jgi:hypothetical protein
MEMKKKQFMGKNYTVKNGYMGNIYTVIFLINKKNRYKRLFMA